MMMMYRKGNYFLFLLIVIVSWAGCKDAKITAQRKPQNKFFTLADSTQLELPPTFILSENLNSESQFVAQVYSDFLANLETPPMKVTFFVDSLEPNHHLAAYQIDHVPYNQNMAALLNTKLTQQFQRFDESQDCYYLKKVEAMQYASQEWNALKFKFDSGKDRNAKSECPKDFYEKNRSIFRAYTTVFYYNGQNKAYFFLEYFDDDDDLDGYLRKIRL